MDYKYNQEPDYVPFQDQLYKYLKHWKLFLIFGIICLSTAFIYLKYTPIEYKVTATILIKGEKTGLLSELSAFKDLNIAESSNKEVENEIEILKSRPLFERVVRKLNLQYQYFAKTKFSKRLIELYENMPITVVLAKDSLKPQGSADFVITIISENQYILEEEAQDFTLKGIFEKPIKTSLGNLILFKNTEVFDSYIGNEIYLSIKPIMDVVEECKASVSIGLVHKDANVISLRLNTATKQKAKDILNTLIESYNIDAISDKNKVYENTAEFVKERLTIINRELSNIEKGVESFKTTNRLTDVTTEAELFLENASETKKQVLTINTQLGLVRFMADYLKNNSEGLLPANLGFANVAIVGLITKYNEIALKRDEVLKGTTIKNPMVIGLNQKLKSLKKSLEQSLNNQKTSLRIELRDLEKQDAATKAKIASLPKQERELRDIVRQQEIKETLYLYLLQKREETAISLAATVANTKIIESAYSSKFPIKPKKRIVFLVVLLGSLLLPIIMIFFKDLLDVKIKDRQEIQKSLDIPFVAEIPDIKTKDQYIISNEDRSIQAESFRIFESNLKFLLSEQTNTCKTILVTSSVTGEGKTFISANLAITLSNPDKKVVLVGLDLRSPKIADYLNLKDGPGISNYLRDENLAIQNIIVHNDSIANLDIINSGIIPPNPIELLKSRRFYDLIQNLQREYDYIIIDTPPVSMVADALLLSDLADLCIYVIRSGFTDKRSLPVLQNLYNDNRFKKITVLLNGTENTNKGYYGYAYGTNKVKSNFWDKIVSRSSS